MLFPSLLCFFSVGAAILFAIAVIVRLAVLAGRVVLFVLCRFLVERGKFVYDYVYTARACVHGPKHFSYWVQNRPQ